MGVLYRDGLRPAHFKYLQPRKSARRPVPGVRPRDDKSNDSSLAIRPRDVEQELNSRTEDYSESRKMIRNKISKKQKNEEDEEHEVCS